MKKIISILFVVALTISTTVVKADFTFGEPVNLGSPFNTSYGEHGVCISSDGLEFYFMSNRPGGYGGYDLWVMKRATIQDDWGSPENAGSPANTRYCYWEPTISLDCLTLYFSDGHLPPFGNHLPGGLGGDGDIWMLSRETVDGTWGPPINIGPTINSQHAVSPSLSADGLSLYFQSHRPGHLGEHCDIMIAIRETTSDSFGIPVFLEKVNSLDSEWMPDISADGLALIFCRNIATELWMATRATIYDDFDTPVKLPPQINIPSYINASPTFSADGTILYFGSDRPGSFGSYDLWQVSIDPIVDLNGDGIVDADDMCIMVDRWGTDNSLCDIGPMPWGDGIVDVQDLIVLAEHFFEAENDPTLIAHWPLDEVQGVIAYNDSSDCDATLIGDPVWQPDSGMLAGVLQFDGIDDYASTEFVLNPTAGNFSIFAWIKGGGPGQVIISQVGEFGEIWLGIDTSEGKLITGIFDVFFDPLVSDTVVTDGQWHHVGLVYDLDVYHRRLYLDGTLVTEDTTVVYGVSSDGGLYIGASKDLEGGSFFSGLVDDVRIYRRVLSPQEIAALAQ